MADTYFLRTEHVRENLIRFIRACPLGNTKITVSEPTRRSAEQNAKMWAMLGEVARQVQWHGQWLSDADWKDMATAAIKRQRGGRRRGRDAATTRDWLAESITLKRGLIGAKPRAFCMWVFDLLGAAPGDTLDDIFPGTGAVGVAWEEFVGARPPRELVLESQGLQKTIEREGT